MSTSAQKVSFTSQLMQSYRLGAPVSAGMALALAPNGNGQTEIFSIGADKHTYNIYPDTGSDTGWSMTDMNFPSQAIYIAAAGNADGTVTVYACDSTNNIYYISSQRWGTGWQNLPTGYATVTVGGLQVSYDSGNNPFLILLNTALNNFGILLSDNTWGYFGYNPSNIYSWTAAMIADSGPFVGINNMVNNGIYASMSSIVTEGDRGIIGEVWYNGESDCYGKEIIGSYSAITVGRNSNGYDEPFVLSTQDNGIYYLYITDPAAPQFQSLNISGDESFSAIAGGLNAQNQLEVFALDATGYLYHLRQDTTSSSGWTTIIQLNNSVQLAKIQAIHNPAGYSDVFGVTSGNQLYHIWQDPVTTDWNFEEIALDTRGDIEEFSSYNIQMTVYDTNEVVVPNSAVKIFCNDPVTIDINGSTCFLNAQIPWSGTSNDSGQVTITLETASLGIPPINVWTALMDPEDRIAVDPSTTIHNTLSSIDNEGQALLDANVTDNQGNQTPLIQGAVNRDPKVVASVAQAIKSAMSLAVTAPEKNIQYLHRFSKRNITRYQSGGKAAGQIDLPAVKEQHWQVDFTSGKPAFRNLSRQEADKMIQDKQALPPLSSFFGFDVDWGDVFNSIEAGICAVVEFVVTTVGDGISAVITFVVRGITYIYNATISLIEQAFDLVEEVFEKIEVGFEQLFGWLGFIFNWDDILRTHEVIAYSINQVYDFQKAALQYVKSNVDNYFSTFESGVTQAFQQMIQGVFGQQNMLAVQATYAPNQPPEADISNHNIAFTGLINNLSGATLNDSQVAARTAQLQASTVDLISLLGQQATNFQSSDAFTNAVAYFEAAAKNQDQLLENTLAGILSIAEGIALFILEGVNTLIDTILDAIIGLIDTIQQLMNTSWDIPFVSDLYRYITKGATLTTTDVIALVLAIPTTVIYKIVNGQSPYPDEDSVNAFKSIYTTQILLTDSGISNGTGTAALRLPSAGNADDGRAVAQKVFGIAGGICTWLYGILDAISDLIPSAETKLPPAKKISTILLGLEINAQVLACPWPFKITGTGISCSDASEFENLIWILQWIGIGMDAVFLSAQGRTTRLADDAGAIIATLWGAANGGMLITLAVKEQGSDNWKTVQNICTFLPQSLKILRLSVIQGSTEEVSLFGLAAIDGLSALAGGVIGLYRSIG